MSSALVVNEPLNASPSDAARPERTGLSAIWWLFLSLLLIVCLAEYGQAWVYPPVATEAALAVADASSRLPLRIALWAMAPLAIVVHLARRGLAGPVAVLMPFALFWLAGLVAGLTGFNPATSMRLVLPWLMMALAATVIGLELPPRRVLRIVLWTMLTLMLGSIALALLLPERGTMLASGVPVWRGLFIGKNWLGQVAAWCLVASLGLAPLMSRRLAWSTAALSLACLIGSGSKGALVGALIALAFAFLISRLGRRMAPTLVAMTLCAGFVGLTLLTVLVLPLLLEALNRDITLTGRTLIWSIYFNDMLGQPWFGQGPGAYTNPSPVTMPLALQLSRYGDIFTPHNAYLGVFGDAGVVGLVGFLVALAGTILVAPLWRPSLVMRASAAIAVTIAITGLVETVHVFGASAGLFLVILLRAVALGNDAHDAHDDAGSIDGGAAGPPA
jgi:exopolysaccharide production protein ExoQ